MLAKMTSKNQVTLPKRVVAAVPSSEYFDITEEFGRIVPTLAHISQADAVREKLVERGLSETDVADAIAWARRAE